MTALLWISLSALTLTYLGYPALMAALAWLRPRPILASAQTPAIDVLLVVHNAAQLLESKLENLRLLDYPPDLLRINIVADGCSDHTESLANRHVSARVRLFAFAPRRGKSACIGSVLPSLDREVILFTDVRQRLDTGAARALAATLADPAIGAASGELMLEGAAGYGRGINAYWRYEKMIRRFESASGSLVGVTGALYAVRREALIEVPAGLLLDDMWIPLGIAERGYRVVVVPQAVAHDALQPDPRSEELRKRRTLAGNFQLLHLWPALAMPGGHPLAWRLWGHKWLRLLAPWWLLAALLANALLAASSTWYLLLLCLQLAAYSAAALGRLLPPLLVLAPVRLCTAFVSLNLSAALALLDYLRNPNRYLWQTSSVEGSRQ